MALPTTTKKVMTTAGVIALIISIGIPAYTNYQKEKVQQTLLAQQQEEEKQAEASSHAESEAPIENGTDANSNSTAGIYIGRSGGSLTPEQEREYEKAKQEIAQQLEDLQKQYDKAQANKGSSSTAPDVKVQPPKTEKPADGITGGSGGVIPAFDPNNKGTGVVEGAGGSGTSDHTKVKWD